MACVLPHLKRRRDYVRVSRSGRSTARAGMVVQARRWDAPAATGDHGDDDGGAGIRLGITASKKVGNAVTRNRARRRLREVARAVLPTRAAPGHDYVLIARASTPSRPYALLIADLIAALSRLRLDRARDQAGAVPPSSGGGGSLCGR